MSEEQEPVLIPGSILALLQHYWRPAQADFSHFEPHASDRERLRDPSFNNYRKDTDELGVNTFVTSEVVQLSKDELFERFIRHQGDVWSVNEHAQHAIQDFLEETYSYCVTRVVACFECFFERSKDIATGLRRARRSSAAAWSRSSLECDARFGSAAPLGR